MTAFVHSPSPTKRAGSSLSDEQKRTAPHLTSVSRRRPSPAPPSAQKSSALKARLWAAHGRRRAQRHRDFEKDASKKRKKLHSRSYAVSLSSSNLILAGPRRGPLPSASSPGLPAEALPGIASASLIPLPKRPGLKSDQSAFPHFCASAWRIRLLTFRQM